ncbi:MAG: ATP-dependent protease LonB, partial [Firmicutes bacterium]|nr:ATP-dependent protease LonB [Bacillota bacterium]
NVLTVLRYTMDVDYRDYDLHINFPGGAPVDGPSAGVGIATAVYSAITDTPVDNTVAMTGEVSIRGLVMPVGGVVPKLEAAMLAGATKVFIPADNYQELFRSFKPTTVIPAETLLEVIKGALLPGREHKPAPPVRQERVAASFLPAAGAPAPREL